MTLRWLLVVLAAGACKGSTAPVRVGSQARDEGGSVALVDLLDGAEVHGFDLAAARATPLPSPDMLAALSETFADDAALRRWHEGLAALAGSAKRASSRVSAPGEATPAVYIPPSTHGLHRIVPVPANAALLVRARVRAATAAGPMPRLGVVVLRDLPRADDAAAIVNVRKQRLRGPPRPEPVSWPGTDDEVDPGRAQEWQELTILLPPAPHTRGLRVSLFEGAGALVERVVVQRVRPFDHPTLGRDGDPARHLLDQVVRFPEEWTRSILLPAGASLRVKARIGAGAPRLELATARHPFMADRPVHLEVRVAGEEGVLATRELFAARGDRPCPEPWTIPLDRFAGRAIELELAARGAVDAVAVLADPWLLSTATERPGPNLLLISIDTLRRDALGAFGNPHGRTPALDRLAREGVCFTQATSPSSYTLPAHGALFSGQHPLVHGATTGIAAIDGRRSPLLAPLLRRSGWQTAAFTGGGFVHPSHGFGEGFGSYGIGDPGGVSELFQQHREEPPTAQDAFPELAPALDWIVRRRDQPFFLFLHTYFVHNYSPGDAFLPATRAARLPKIATGVEWMEDFERGRQHVPELRELYDAAVAETDARLVAPLLAALDGAGLADSTLVVLLSDHGEEFAEHGGLFHGRALWNELVAVPLMLRGPGVPRGGRRDDAATLEDVAPTIAARLGLPRADGWQGRDLFAEDAEAEAGDARLLHLLNGPDHERFHWVGLLSGGYSLLRRHDPVSLEPAQRLLFDLLNDPRQERDLAGAEPAAVAALERRLEQELARQAEIAALLWTGREATVIDDDAGRNLRKLGYVDDR